MALTEQIDNYPGFENGIDGFSLAENMQKQAERFGARSEYAEVLRMDLTAVPSSWRPARDLPGKTVVLPTGADPRTLGVAGETELLGRGVAYCAACDGMFYKGKTVVGGRRQFRRGRCPPFSRVAKKWILVHRRDTPAGHQDLSRAAGTGRKRGIPLEQRRFRAAFRGQADRRPPAETPSPVRKAWWTATAYLSA